MRTLDDIIPPSRRKESEPLSTNPIKRETKPPQFPFTTFFITIFIIVVSIAALIYFSDASVEVTPKSVSAAVQATFTGTESTGALPYEIVVSEKIASRNVKSSGTKMVNTAAGGTITIYNSQTKAQTLIATTRFATSGGLVFRIKDQVTVPAGTTAKPGTITARVYADKAGDTYNIDPTSFTLPGFAGKPQEKLVYARSTSAMTGGASGNMPVIDSALETQTRESLQNALEPDLVASISAKVPEGYVLLPGASAITYQTLSSTPSASSEQVEVREQGTITAVVFPNAVLAETIATSVGGFGYQGEPLTLASTETIKLTPTVGMPAAGAASFAFTLSGTAQLVYTVDSNRIAAAISGKTRSVAKTTLKNYPEVQSALIFLRPFWRQTLPEDPASITVKLAAPSI